MTSKQKGSVNRKSLAAMPVRKKQGAAVKGGKPSSVTKTIGETRGIGAGNRSGL